ncbi:MAG: hypothetical protein HYW71_01480 [Candidatus Niyogibacteria bacterium]|nr:hypothetical protein [Candidatus Niyogibacteria bacterium]
MITKKYKTPSQVTGSYVEFQVAVLRALPRDINPVIALGWTQNGESLARVLREAFTPYGKPAGNINSFSVSLPVNYRRSVKDAVKAGHYDSIDSNIISHIFSTQRKGTAKVTMEFFCFGRDISTNEALSKLNKRGFRPTELHELLAFGENYPELQGDFLIVALSIWKSPNGLRYAPCLDRRGSTRFLDLCCADGDEVWDKSCWFAAVRKK